MKKFLILALLIPNLCFAANQLEFFRHNDANRVTAPLTLDADTGTDSHGVSYDKLNDLFYITINGTRARTAYRKDMSAGVMRRVENVVSPFFNSIVLDVAHDGHRNFWTAGVQATAVGRILLLDSAGRSLTGKTFTTFEHPLAISYDYRNAGFWYYEQQNSVPPTYFFRWCQLGAGARDLVCSFSIADSTGFASFTVIRSPNILKMGYDLLAVGTTGIGFYIDTKGVQVRKSVSFGVSGTVSGIDDMGNGYIVMVTH